MHEESSIKQWDPKDPQNLQKSITNHHIPQLGQEMVIHCDGNDVALPFPAIDVMRCSENADTAAKSKPEQRCFKISSFSTMLSNIRTTLLYAGSAIHSDPRNVR
jgi:hypothetical protein